MKRSSEVQSAMDTAKNADQLHPDDYEYDSVVNDLVVLAAAIETKDKQITELEAVVVKLPKTADGKYVTPGMRYWFEYMDAPGEFGDDFASTIRHDGPGKEDCFEDCYSTREAAIAAKETSDDN